MKKCSLPVCKLLVAQLTRLPFENLNFSHHPDILPAFACLHALLYRARESSAIGPIHPHVHPSLSEPPTRWSHSILFLQSTYLEIRSESWSEERLLGQKSHFCLYSNSCEAMSNNCWTMIPSNRTNSLRYRYCDTEPRLWLFLVKTRKKSSNKFISEFVRNVYYQLGRRIRRPTIRRNVHFDQNSDRKHCYDS